MNIIFREKHCFISDFFATLRCNFRQHVRAFHDTPLRDQGWEGVVRKGR